MASCPVLFGGECEIPGAVWQGPRASFWNTALSVRLALVRGDRRTVRLGPYFLPVFVSTEEKSLGTVRLWDPGLRGSVIVQEKQVLSLSVLEGWFRLHFAHPGHGRVRAALRRFRTAFSVQPGVPFLAKGVNVFAGFGVVPAELSVVAADE